jgi:hypothetical protein
MGSQDLQSQRSLIYQIALTHIANVAMNRLTVTNDITSWKSSLIGKTLLRCLYVCLLFFFCSKVKHTKSPISAMVFEILMEGKSVARSEVGDFAVLERHPPVHAACQLKIMCGYHG